MSPIRTCTHPGCERKYHGKGYCSLHWERLKNGIPLDKEVRVSDPDRGCKVKGCERKYLAKGYCEFHYVRLKNGTPLDKEVQVQDSNRGCKVEGCKRKYLAKGYCRLHWYRLRKGTPLDQEVQVQDSNRGCKVEGCERKYKSKGYCDLHWRRFRKGIPLDKEVRVSDPDRGCKVEGCEGKHAGKGYCRFHYERHKNGVPLELELQKGWNNISNVVEEFIEYQDGKWLAPAKKAANGIGCQIHFLRKLDEGESVGYTVDHTFATVTWSTKNRMDHVISAGEAVEALLPQEKFLRGLPEDRAVESLPTIDWREWADTGETFEPEYQYDTEADDLWAGYEDYDLTFLEESI